MTEFVALRSKVYAYKKIDRKLKEYLSNGKKKCIVVERLTFDEYKTGLLGDRTIYREQMCLSTRNTRCTR